MTDEGAGQVGTYAYDAWGNVTASSGAEGNEYKFTSRRWDSAVGLQYNRARFYDPAIGRFISPDPLTGGPDDPTISYFGGLYSAFHRFLKEYVDALQPDKLNRYVYCYNNPVNLIDPLGLHIIETAVYGAWQQAAAAAGASAAGKSKSGKNSGKIVGEIAAEGVSEVLGGIKAFAAGVPVAIQIAKNIIISDIRRNIPYLSDVRESGSGSDTVESSDRKKEGVEIGTAEVEASAEIETRNAGEKYRDLKEHPEDWEQTSPEKIKDATGGRYREGGKVHEREYTHKKTGERVYESVIRGPNGEIMHGPHPRDYPK